MKRHATIAPPYSVIFVMDFESGDTPQTFAGQLVAKTSTCVAIGTLSEQDGQTTIVVTNDPDEVLHVGEHLAFEGSIAVPSKVLSVVTALNEPVMSLDIRDEVAFIRIWVNDQSEPDHIVIVVT